nr:MAG TPA: hypothetical protein [Caudoviricetes sp.]
MTKTFASTNSRLLLLKRLLNNNFLQNLLNQVF